MSHHAAQAAEKTIIHNDAHTLRIKGSQVKKDFFMPPVYRTHELPGTTPSITADGVTASERIERPMKGISSARSPEKHEHKP